MNIIVPIENQEIPQTGLDYESTNKKSMKGEKVKGVELKYNNSKREVHAEWNKLKDTEYYSYQFYTSHLHPDNSALKQGITKKCEAALGGLKKEHKVFIRVRSIGSDGLGAWSEPAEMKIP